MKWLNLLKNKQGKFVLGLPQLAGIAGVGLLATYGAVQYDKAEEKALAVRSVASITNPYSYEGMQGDSRSGLTSVNVKDGLNQVASAEDRARLEGRTTRNNFGLDVVDGLSGRVESASGVGQASQTGDTDGLGMGANRASYVGTRSGTNAAGSRGVPGGQQGVSRPQQQLASAPMARAQGSAFNAAAGAVAGGNAGGAGSSTRGGGEGYRFSGAMPQSSSAVESLTGSLDGTRSGPSGYMAGGRNGYAKPSTRPDAARGDLEYIAKRSADAARNENRSTNEGARAFLSGDQNASGMSFEDGIETTATGSSDFSALDDAKLQGIKNWGDAQTKKSKKQEKDRKVLVGLLIGLGVITYAGVWGGSVLRAAGNPWGWVVLGVVGLAAATVAGFAIKYANTYNTTVFPGWCYAASGLAAGLAALAAVSPNWVSGWFNLKKLLNWGASSFVMPALSSQIKDDINSDK